MKKFIKNILLKSSLFFVLLFLLIGGVVFINYNHKVDYPAAIINKHERLDSLKNTAKIMICGGSSSAYSIDSKLLQKTFKKPVVNTSLAMSLGSKFHLNLIKNFLHKGDVILYIPEYEYYYGRESGDDFLYTTAFYYPKIIKYFTKEQKNVFFEKAVRLSINYYIGAIKGRGNESFQYRRDAYNYLGDNISLISVKDSKVTSKPINRYQGLNNKKLSKEFISFFKKNE